MTPEQLKGFRDRIDALDDQILPLMVERAKVVQEVGRNKHKVGAAVFRPEREVAIIERLCEMNRALGGPLPDQSIASIWLEVISGCRALERVMKVSYLGPAGTYSEQAVRTLFGHRVEVIACASLDEAVRMAETGGVDAALLPIENSIEGTVGRTLDLLASTSLLIASEVSIPIHHCLLSMAYRLEEVRQVGAHPQALAQCQAWLDRFLPGIPRIPMASNGEAAAQAQTTPGLAAIAGQTAGQHYGLRTLAERIEDDPRNRTRFVALGNFKPEACGQDQTSLILSVPDRAGAMLSLIEPLARHGVSMKRFESRPARQGAAWEYLFYVDLVGHQSEPSLQAALAEIRERAGLFKHMGSYPLFDKLTAPAAPLEASA